MKSLSLQSSIARVHNFQPGDANDLKLSTKVSEVLKVSSLTIKEVRSRTVAPLRKGSQKVSYFVDVSSRGHQGRRMKKMRDEFDATVNWRNVSVERHGQAFVWKNFGRLG